MLSQQGERVTNKNMSWFERGSHVIKAGAATTALGGIGDFLTPVGGWAWLAAGGCLALLFWILLWIWPGLHGWVKSLFPQGTQARVWRTPFTTSLASGMVLTIAAVGIVCGSISYSRAGEGGLMASSFPMAASMQKMAGIAERSLQEQTRTRKGVEDLVRIQQTGEAQDVRVTLANRGVEWSPGRLDDALMTGDMDTVALFLKGGMSIKTSVGRDSSLGRFFRDYSPEVAEVLKTQAHQVPASSCLPYRIEELESWLSDAARIQLYVAICDKPEVRSKLQEMQRADVDWSREVLASNRNVSRNRTDCVSRLQRELPLEKAVLVAPKYTASSDELNAPEQRVAHALAELTSRPDMDDATLYRRYPAIIKDACEQAFVERPLVSEDGLASRVLAAF